MRTSLYFLWYFALAACSQGTTTPQSENLPPKEIIEQPLEPAKITLPLHSESFTMPKNSSTYTELNKLGFTAQEIHKLIMSSKPIQPLHKIRAGTPFTIWWSSESKSTKVKLEMGLSPTQVIRFRLDQDDWSPELVALPVDKLSKTFSGTVRSSLWNSAIESGMEPNLIAEFAEIFAWQIDFSREVRQGDRWRIIVNEKFVRGESIGWSDILAAQYSTSAGELYSGVKYPPHAKRASYYQEDGSSLRRLFLKNPIKFGRISSHFTNRRFHPILKRNRPHYGVDYAAPRGTPVRSVGDGRVVFVGRNGGSGKMIKIRHNSIYTTAYLHLSNYARGVKKGANIKQGQTIGYVGQTGLATGPHLHFSFYKYGRYIDPLKVKFPSAKPIPETEINDFAAVAQELLSSLPDWQSIENIAEQKPKEPSHTRTQL